MTRSLNSFAPISRHRHGLNELGSEGLLLGCNDGLGMKGRKQFGYLVVNLIVKSGRNLQSITPNIKQKQQPFMN